MTRIRISRRDMLKLTGISASAFLLGACTGNSEAETAAKTATTAPQAQSTPSPTQIQSTAEPAATSVPREMVMVEAGSFIMGSDESRTNERPAHLVNITRSFFLGTYMVTMAQYDQYCAHAGKSRLDDRGWGRGNRPATGLTWIEAIEYCTWLSESEGFQPCYSGVRKNTECDFMANGYRLPTEAEWEFAARGGNLSQGYKYPGSDDPLEVAWHEPNAGGRTQQVGQLKANELGIHGMSGNAAEWCWDWYGMDYYARSPQDDPTGLARNEIPSDQFEQVKSKRGGFYNERAEYIYSTFRTADGYNYPGGGMRLARTGT
jgi:formylglycine-generating enzyme required for sulfatase activity